MKNLFNSKKEAIAFLQSVKWLEQNGDTFAEPGVFNIFHGQYTPKTFSVHRFKDGFAIHCNRIYLADSPKNSPVAGRLTDQLFNYAFRINDPCVFIKTVKTEMVRNTCPLCPVVISKQIYSSFLKTFGAGV
jgi:hypothetical protein